MSDSKSADKRVEETFPPVGGRPEGIGSALLRDRPAVAGGYGAILGVLAAALVCRAGAAFWWGDLLWADAVFYRQIVLALQRGDFANAFDSLGLNLYPVILMWLDRLGAWVGADWTVVGKWWSVLLASLAVLPFYGWVRRIFDDRVAFWAGLFYVIHPHLVGHSPLIIRDPTYWFLFNLALYLSWRAVTEARLGVFLGAGVCIGLAAYTRTEGCLLLGVLLGWALCRAASVREARWRLAFGLLLAAAVIPAGVAAVNLTWLRNHPRWEWGRVPLFQRTWNWTIERMEEIFSSQTGDKLLRGAESVGENGTTFSLIRSTGINPIRQAKLASIKQLCSRQQNTHFPAAKPIPTQKQQSLGNPSAVNRCQFESALEGKAANSKGQIAKPSEWVQVRRVAFRLIKALTYPYALLIGVGLVRAWRILLRADQIVVSLHNLLLFLATWFYQSFSSGIDFRYLFPILLTALPYAAVGFEAVLAGICWLATAGRRGWRPGGRITVVGGVVLLVGLGLLDVQPSATKLMRQQTALGQWVLRSLGPGSKIFCPESASILLGYHAQAECQSWPRQEEANFTALRELLLQDRPDVVILWDDPLYPDRRWMQLVAELCSEFGYQKTPADELPEPARRCQVWVRPQNRPLPEGNTPVRSSSEEQ